MKLFRDQIQFLHNVMQQLLRIEKNTYCLYFSDLMLVFTFLSTVENQYMNHLVWNLLYDICNTSIELIQKIKSHRLIHVSKFTWNLEQSYLKSSSITLFAQCVNFILSLLECITHSSSTSFEEINLIAIVNWVFHVSEFWRSIMILLKIKV